MHTRIYDSYTDALNFGLHQTRWFTIEFTSRGYEINYVR